jgi:hypothetical protein
MAGPAMEANRTHIGESRDSFIAGTGAQGDRRHGAAPAAQSTLGHVRGGDKAGRGAAHREDEATSLETTVSGTRRLPWTPADCPSSGLRAPPLRRGEGEDERLRINDIPSRGSGAVALAPSGRGLG